MGTNFSQASFPPNEVYKTQTNEQTKRPNKRSLPGEWGRNKTHLAFQQPLCLFSVLDGHAAHCNGLLKIWQLLEELHRWMIYLLVEPVHEPQEEELVELHRETVPPPRQT